MTPEEKESILEIGRVLQSIIANFDDHLKIDHKMVNHGYKSPTDTATLRYYLQNCSEQLSKALTALSTSENKATTGAEQP